MVLGHNEHAWTQKLPQAKTVAGEAAAARPRPAKATAAGAAGNHASYRNTLIRRYVKAASASGRPTEHVASPDNGYTRLSARTARLVLGGEERCAPHARVFINVFSRVFQPYEPYIGCRCCAWVPRRRALPRQRQGDCNFQAGAA